MGKSNSIQQQLKKNQEFVDYVQKISADMATRQDDMASKLAAMEKDHYASFDDKALLMEGRYSHLTTVSEWSLKSISDIIESCSNALFGKKAPEGSSKPESDKKVSSAIEAIKERAEYISNQAFDVIQSIVGSFSNSTTTSIEQKLDGKPVAPGMTLFIGVENNAFSAESFFKNEKIIQTIFVFRVCYSLKEGRAQSSLSDLQAYEDQKESFRNKIEQLLNMLDSLDVGSDDFEEQEKKYTERLDLMNARLEKLNEKIAGLQANAINNVQNFCADIRKKLQSRRQNCLSARREIVSPWFVCTLSSTKIEDAVHAWCPKDVALYLEYSDAYSDPCYCIHFYVSNDNYTEDFLNGRISQALTGKGNFYFTQI